MKLTDEPAIAILNELLPICRASEQGFLTAAADATEPELAQLFRGYATQRRKFADAIEARLRDLRAAPPRAPLAGSQLHRDWMDLRAAAAQAPLHALLEETERGEDLAVKAYANALQTRDVDEITRRIVQNHYEQIEAAHARLRQLRDSEAYAYR